MSIEEPIIEAFETSGLVKIAAIFLIGLMILGGFMTAVQNDNPKSVSVTLTQIPQNGETITLGSHVFEFTNGGQVASEHIPVEIGSTLVEAGTNFKNAVSANTDFTAA